MPPMTEIYLCKDGQSLREGKLELSTTITNKRDAERDARSRCEYDSWIKRIAYYSVDDSGAFKLFYSYTNDKAITRKARPPRVGNKPERIPLKSKTPPSPRKKPKSLIQKLTSTFK